MSAAECRAQLSTGARAVLVLGCARAQPCSAILAPALAQRGEARHRARRGGRVDGCSASLNDGAIVMRYTDNPPYHHWRKGRRPSETWDGRRLQLRRGLVLQLSTPAKGTAGMQNRQPRAGSGVRVERGDEGRPAGRGKACTYQGSENHSKP